MLYPVAALVASLLMSGAALADSSGETVSPFVAALEAYVEDFSHIEEFGDALPSADLVSKSEPVVLRHAEVLIAAASGDCEAVINNTLRHMKDNLGVPTGTMERRMLLWTADRHLILHFPCPLETKLKVLLPLLGSGDKSLEVIVESYLDVHAYEDPEGEPAYDAFVPYLKEIPKEDSAVPLLVEYMMEHSVVESLRTLADVWLDEAEAKADIEAIATQLGWENKRRSIEDEQSSTWAFNALVERPEWWARLAAVDLMYTVHSWRSDEVMASLMQDPSEVVRRSMERFHDMLVRVQNDIELERQRDRQEVETHR